ncbi:MAG: hypothetical protein IKQ77_07165 [Prevotella sp.]|nr:hypothetical protein [Prevotella sp.]
MFTLVGSGGKGEFFSGVFSGVIEELKGSYRGVKGTYVHLVGGRGLKRIEEDYRGLKRIIEDRRGVKGYEFIWIFLILQR